MLKQSLVISLFSRGTISSVGEGGGGGGQGRSASAIWYLNYFFWWRVTCMTSSLMFFHAAFVDRAVRAEIAAIHSRTRHYFIMATQHVTWKESERKS